MLSYIRKSENGYLQGAVFLANLLIRPFLYNSARKKNQFTGDVYSKLLSFKQSDTLFILGSGESINDLDDQQFDVIQQCDSIGFNFWLLHEFVPTFYVAEFLPKSTRSDLLWKNLAARTNDYHNVPIVFKYSAAFLEQRYNIPKDLGNWYVLPHLSIPGNGAGSFGRWLKFLDMSGILTGRIVGDITLFRQASLSWILVFALRLQYKKIVFCGVDLNSPNYFYDMREADTFSSSLFVPPREFFSEVHPTNNSSNCNGHMPISNVIDVFAEKICSKHHIDLFTASEKSALYPGLPLYLW